MNKIKFTLRVIIFGIIFISSTQSNSEVKNQKLSIENKSIDNKVFTQKLNSTNSQPVGLIGGNISAVVILTEGSNKNKKKPIRDYIEFSDNVLVNSYGKRGCVASSCVMEVRFDQGELFKYKIYESENDTYMRKIYISDSDFKNKALKSKDISIKMRFADSVDGIFVFRKNI
jgi:hypothetical protein